MGHPVYIYGMVQGSGGYKSSLKFPFEDIIINHKFIDENSLIIICKNKLFSKSYNNENEITFQFY